MAKRTALLIGDTEYQDATLTRLKTPGADVRSLAVALRDPSIGEFDEVTELIDESEATVRRAIASFFGRRHPEDLLLLYFSGHGVKDDRGRLYLAVKDTSCQQLSATGIASSFVSEQMDECRSRRQILILDCCNSGAFARGCKGDANALTQDTFAGNGYGRVVLTASDATQYAFEGDQVIERAELSLFTHYLLEGLTSGAASDEDVITLDTLYDYAYGKVVSSTPGQTPRKWVYNQQGGLIIAKNPRRRDALPVTIDAEIRARVQDADAAKRFEAVADRVARQLSRLSLRGAWVLTSVLAVAVAGGINGGVFGATLVLASGRMMAGLVEGGLFAVALYVVMRRFGVAVNPVAWVLAILVAEVVRWQIPIPGWPYQTTSGGVVFKGLVDGAIVGVAQAWALGLKGNVQKLWIGSSAVGWTVAMFAWAGIGTAFIRTIARSPMLPSILMGAATGLAVGAATCVFLTSLPREQKG